MKTIARITKNKSVKTVLALGMLALITTSCSSDDDNPIAVDEEEVITTMNVFLISAGSTVKLQSIDLDGDGPNPPEINFLGNLNANTTYAGTIELLNETETPADVISEEVKEEGVEHQFFFTSLGAINSVTYTDQDGNGNPIGLSFTLDTGESGNGTLQITLRHEPKKPNDGSLADAGGETDIAQTFTVLVE